MLIPTLLAVKSPLIKGVAVLELSIASVFVVKNVAQKLMGNAYITFNKPITPTKIFTNEDEAVKWLKTFIS